jgi:uncharacterized membrane protein YphA (DoxX/SURF4 family)/thiol-disulfide isomerase/thioredoxin
MQDVLPNTFTPTGATSANKTRRLVAGICAILLGIIFLVSGAWKMLDPVKTGEVLEQAQVPAGWGAIGAATLGTLEVFAAFLLFTPRYRKWGGYLGSALLIFFIGWIAIYYKVLVGHDCSCFPIIKRAINPMFFVSDGIMLLLGIAAWLWSAPVKSFKGPLVLLVLLAGLSGVNYAWSESKIIHAQIPNPVIVDGKPADLSKGKVLIFFYDPSCMHCDAAARFMANFDWENTRVVAIPTVNPQWAASFLSDTKLKAGTSLELDKLKKVFPFVDPPYGIALNDGVVKETFGQAEFTPPAPKARLQQLGFVK